MRWTSRDADRAEGGASAGTGNASPRAGRRAGAILYALPVLLLMSAPAEGVAGTQEQAEVGELQVKQQPFERTHVALGSGDLEEAGLVLSGEEDGGASGVRIEVADADLDDDLQAVGLRWSWLLDLRRTPAGSRVQAKFSTRGPGGEGRPAGTIDWGDGGSGQLEFDVDFSAATGSQEYDLTLYRNGRPVLMDDGPFQLSGRVDPVPVTKTGPSRALIDCIVVGNLGACSIGPITICYMIDSDGKKHIITCPSNEREQRDRMDRDAGRRGSSGRLQKANREVRRVRGDRITFRAHGLDPEELRPRERTSLSAVEMRVTGATSLKLVDESLVVRRPRTSDDSEFCYEELPYDISFPMEPMPVPEFPDPVLGAACPE